MITKMEEIKERIAAVAGGGVFGLFGGIKLLQTNFNVYYLEFPLKLLGTVILSAIGGIVGLMIKDLYQHKIKAWWIDKIKNRKQ